MSLRHVFAVMMCVPLLAPQVCTGHDKTSVPRTVQDEPSPYFTSMTWPVPYAVLPEGRLVITGNLQCPAGYFEEMPMSVTMYPADFIEPPLAIPLFPPPSQENLESALEANPKVQQWISEMRSQLFRRVTEGPFVEDVESWRDLPEGLQSQALFSELFDEYNYVNFEIGDFRIDFDQTARLTPGDVILMVSGIDALGASA